MATAMLVGAPQPWPPPPTPTSTSASNDCPPGICSFTCRQYCTPFFLQPPPQQQSQLPFINTNPDDSSAAADDNSSRTISPLMAALIAVLAAAFLLLFYYTVVSRLCKRRRNQHRRLLRALGSSSPRADPLVHDPARPDTGLDDAFIRQITVFKYNRADGLVEGTECAVCLVEFSENESLRLMPNCEHAFHIPCIDTWLQSHSNCPLCRSTMNPLPVRSAETNNTNNTSAGGNAVNVAAMRVERGSDAVSVLREEVLVEVVVEAVAGNEERGEERSRKLDDRNGRSR